MASFGDVVHEIANKNMEIAQTFWHYSENFGGIEERTPSFDDPVVFSEAKVLSAMPEVDGRINSGESTFILVGWGEKHAGNIEKVIPNSPCQPTRVTLSERGVRNSLKATFRFLRVERLVDVTGPIISVPFSKDELEADIEKEENSTAARKNKIEVTLNGTIYFDYDETEQGYKYRCDEEGSCKCERYESGRIKTFEKFVSDRRSFEVEAEKLDYFVFGPSLLENVVGRNVLEIFIFSRQKLQRIMVLKDDGVIAFRQMHKFHNRSDNFGVWRVRIENESFQEAEGILWKEAFSQPLAVLGENSSFSYLYMIKKEVYFERGKSNISIVVTNDFFKDRYFNFSIITKEKTASIVGDAKNGNFKIVGMDGEVVNEKRERIKSGSILFESFLGNEGYFPSAGLFRMDEGMLIAGDYGLVVVGVIFLYFGFWIGKNI
ncbi:MAG: hypothetical protein QXN01_00015 [Candidatus Anstonellales archaeon]